MKQQWGVRVLVCGSRGFTDLELMRYELSAFDDDTMVVEGCARGADRLAEFVAWERGMTIEHHPAMWNRHGRSAGHIRNREMIDSAPDLVLAFWDGRSRGTEGTLYWARRRKIPTRVIRFDP